MPTGTGYPRGTTAPRWARNIRLPGNAARPLQFGSKGKLLAEEYCRLLCSMRSLDG